MNQSICWTDNKYTDLGGGLNITLNYIYKKKCIREPNESNYTLAMLVRL